MISIAVSLAQLGCIGRSPKAPGTVATVVAGIPAAYLLSLVPQYAAFPILILFISGASYVSDKAENNLGKHDPQEVVIDEVAGYMVTMIGFTVTVKSLFLGLLLFRAFDIWKPWPVSLLHREIPGGLWIVLDDVAAGICAHVFLWAILKIV